MPTGTPYNSFALPYRIKVDDFATHANQDITPALHLLTHTHSDHINGLSAKSFGQVVICSHDAKEMLLRHEVYAERELKELNLRAQKVRTYAHLKVDPIHQPTMAFYKGSRDLLKPIQLNTPTTFELSNNEQVVITALDANHCLGAVMYLIEGSKGSILHTGDFRAEPWFLQSLSRNPFLQPYLSISTSGSLHKSLDCIYLDTACVFSQSDIPTKDDATTGLIALMKLFPPTVYFYINSWTWGYEDIIKAVAGAFQTKIHVDRYKYNIYTNVSDAYMRLIVTRDPTSTRFHACERFHRCDHVQVDNEDNTYDNVTSRLGKRVVYVNPITMESTKWREYLQETKRQLRAGVMVNNLLVPLSRHSTLPELRSFVSLFRPKRIVPNTLDPRLQELDWYFIDRMFEGCLSNLITEQARRLVPLQSHLIDEEEDTALTNLIGCGVVEMTLPWADIGGARHKLETARKYLKGPERQVVDGILGRKPAAAYRVSPQILDRTKGKAVQGLGYRSDDETDDDDDDERGRTAHKLFSSLAGVEMMDTPWQLSSQDSDDEEPQILQATPTSNRPQLSERPDPHPITPATSPIRVINNSSGRVSQLATPTPTHRDQNSIKQQISRVTDFVAPPICLESSPSHRIIAPRDSHLILKAPGKFPLKSPLAEQKNRTSLKADLFSTYSHSLPSPGDSLHHRQSESSVFRAVVQQVSAHISPGTNHQRIGHKSPQKIAPVRGVSFRRSLRPISPLKIRDRGMQSYLQRIKIGERLAQLRPDAVAPSYASKRENLLARYVRLQQKEACTRIAAEYGNGNVPTPEIATRPQEIIGDERSKPTMQSFDPNYEANDEVHDGATDDGGGIDWKRSHDLTDVIRAAIVSGQPIRLPPLKCVDSQSSEYAFR